jgi:hypothetical protein
MAISKKKAKNLPESPKNLDDFNTFVLDFCEIFQKVPLTSFPTTFLGKMVNLCHKKNHLILPLPKNLDNRGKLNTTKNIKISKLLTKAVVKYLKVIPDPNHSSQKRFFWKSN